MKEVLDDNNKVIDAYLTIESKFGMFCSCTQEIMMKTLNLRGKKIISINGKNPYEYFEEMNEKGYITHSTQAKFIEMLSSIDALRAEDYPLKKEDLKVSIKFEGEEEEFAVEYNFEETPFFSQEFKEYYLAEKKKYFKNNIPFPRYEKIELDFKIKKGIINKRKLQDEEDIWQLKDDDEMIKCKVDEDNQFNLLYQRSFSPNDFYNYEDIMYKCFSLFYQNNYKLIIIEDGNTGGKTELCYFVIHALNLYALRSKRRQLLH